MGLINASDLKFSQMYTEEDIATEIENAVALNKLNAYLNAELITSAQIDMLQGLGYSIYSRAGKLEVSWQYA
tara:strand:- start:268 stop:483 length:216 start_codon:yes stop_codon:yes gene_type:complete